MKAKKKVFIACFHPFAPEYIAREYLLGASLDPEVFDVHILTMGDNPIAYPGMIMINQSPLKYPKSDIFDNGVDFELIMQKHLPQLKTVPINTIIGNDIRDEIYSLIENFKNFKIREHKDINVDGFPIGTYSVFWGMRSKKYVNSLDECDESHDIKFREGLIASLIGLKISRFVNEKLNPDIVIVSDAYYPHSLSVLEFFKKANKRTKALGYPNRFVNEFQFVHFDLPFDFKWHHDFIDFWHKVVKNRPCSNLAAVSQHMINLYAGKSNFNYAGRVNSNVDIRSLWNIRKNQHIVVLALRSPDEIGGIKITYDSLENNLFQHGFYELLFESIQDWTIQTIEALKNRDDIFLIIRPHPQQNRSKVQCDDYKFFEDLRRKEIPNVAINMPDDNVSAHLLMQEAELLIAAWSNMILEYSIFDIPVVSIYPKDEYAVPIKDLCFTPKCTQEYREYLNKLNFDEFGIIDWNRVTLSFRWLEFKLNCTHLDLSKHFVKRRDIYSDSLIRFQKLLSRFLNLIKLSSSRYFPLKLINNDREIINPILTEAWKTGKYYYQSCFEALEASESNEKKLIKDSITNLLFKLDQHSKLMDNTDSPLLKKWRKVIPND